MIVKADYWLDAVLYVKEAFSNMFSKDYKELWSELSPPAGLFFLIETIF